MKRCLMFAALLTLLSPLVPAPAQAAGASIILAPGVTLNFGDRDGRGYYWDGGRWREPRWWNDRYTWNERRWWRHDAWRRQQQWEHRRHERERRWAPPYRGERGDFRSDRGGFGPYGPPPHRHDHHGYGPR